MIEDPIVEEIYRTREKILADCGEDLDKLLHRYQLAEKQDQARLVTKDMLKDQVKLPQGTCQQGHEGPRDN